MLASLRSAAVFGVEAYPVHVEVDVAFGLPHFSMVGLPDATVKESRDRVRSAIASISSSMSLRSRSARSSTASLVSRLRLFASV